MEEKPRFERRAAAAEKLEKLAQGLIDSLDEIPSYAGKARFMDRVHKVRNGACNLACELRADAGEVTRK